MSSRTRGNGAADADRLTGIKAIQRVLKDHGIFVTRTTLNVWRSRNSPRMRPPITLEILGNRPVLTSSRKELEAWIERARRKHLFQRSTKNHETRKRRRALIRKVQDRAQTVALDATRSQLS